MITDVKTTFAKELEAVGVTAQVGDLIDLGAEYDASIGNEISCRLVVTTVYAAGTSQAFAVRTCATEGGTYVEKGTTGAILTAALVKGLEKEIKVSGLSRYVQLYRTAVGTATGGAVSASISGR